MLQSFDNYSLDSIIKAAECLEWPVDEDFAQELYDFINTLSPAEQYALAFECQYIWTGDFPLTKKEEPQARLDNTQKQAEAASNQVLLDY